MIIKNPKEYVFVIFKDYVKKEVDFEMVNCPSHSIKPPVFSMEFKTWQTT
jgi:hypothetical protein